MTPRSLLRRRCAALLMLLGSMAIDAAEPAGAPPAAPATAAPTAERSAELSQIRRERGLDVCRNSADGKLKYRGITQGYEQRKVQVLVTGIVYADSGEAVAKFRETNVWDDPENWAICKP